ncbi:MAG: YfhO family protein, partial [Anaerolineae bacterium]|nr:YfhO family protein [Anaerolineae bacterium]
HALEGMTLAAGLMVAAAVCGGLAQRYRWWRSGLVLLVLVELVATGALADAERSPSQQNNPHRAAVAYLQADDGWFRVDVDGAARGLWSPAAVMAEGFAVPQGTGNPMEIITYNQFYWGVPHKGMPAYSVLGAKYIIVPKHAQPGGEGIWPVFEEDQTIDIHLNTNALPRVWLIYRTLPVNSLEAAYAYVFSADFDPEVTATVTGGPLLSESGSGRIEVVAYRPNRAAFFVETSAPSLLVLSDLLYPGWKARVDGMDVPIWTTNGLFRGVLVPAGAHRIEMRFVPISLRMGLGFLLMALMIMAKIHYRTADS